MEINMEDKISRLLDQSKIPHRHVLEKTLIAFEKSLLDGTEFYPQYSSHPREDGYRAYAKTASELWIEMNRK